MTKVIRNLELLKKFAPHLDGEETEYVIKNGSIISRDKYNILVWNNWVPEIVEEEIIGGIKRTCNECNKELKTYDSFKCRCDCSNWKTWFLWIDYIEHRYNEDDFIKTLTTDELFTFMWKSICYFTMPYPNAWQLNWWTVIWDKEIIADNLNEYFWKCVDYLIDKNILWMK